MGPRFRRRLAELLYRLRTEGSTRREQVVSVAVGAFVAAVPLYGVHLPLCVLLGKLLRLNRILMYAAANLNNPLVYPFLLYAEVQAGSLIRRGRTYAWSIEEIRAEGLVNLAADIGIGALVVGAFLATAAGGLALLLSRRQLAPELREIVERTARPYLDAGISDWEFVRGKLRWDPVYFDLLARGVLPATGVLYDLGCGRAILLSLLETYRRLGRHGERPAGWGVSPELELHGVERSRRALRAARTAIGDRAELIRADLVAFTPPACDVIVVLDVLHYLRREAQEAVLDAATAALRPGGLLLLREIDADGLGRARRTVIAERVRALLRGRPVQRFHFRTGADWSLLLEKRGLEVRAVTESGTRLLQNLLIEARRRP